VSVLIEALAPALCNSMLVLGHRKAVFFFKAIFYPGDVSRSCTRRKDGKVISVGNCFSASHTFHIYIYIWKIVTSRPISFSMQVLGQIQVTICEGR